MYEDKRGYKLNKNKNKNKNVPTQRNEMKNMQTKNKNEWINKKILVSWPRLALVEINKWIDEKKKKQIKEMQDEVGGKRKS